MPRKRRYTNLDVYAAPFAEGSAPKQTEQSYRSINDVIERDKQARRDSELTAQREGEAAKKADAENRLRDYYSGSVSYLDGEGGQFVRLGVRDDYSPLEESATEPDAVKKFLAGLAARGVTLSDSGKQRIAAYCDSQNTHTHGRVGITERNLKAAYERLKTLGCFAPGEIIERRLSVESQEPTIPTVDTILATTDTSSREGNATLRKAVDAEWMQAYAPIIEEFYSFLRDVYGVSLKDEDATYLFNPVTGWFSRMGYSINEKSLNACRRHMATSHRWVDAQGHPAISVEEYFSAKLSRGEMDYPSFSRECQRFSRLNLWNAPLGQAKTKGLL